MISGMTVSAGCMGSKSDVDVLVEAAYVQLRRLAKSYLSRERIDHTLQPTGLVNEAYLRLADQKRTQWRDRSHFVATAALLMRRVLREYARGRNTSRRGGRQQRLLLEDAPAVTGGSVVEFVAIEQALEGLSKLNPQAAQVVELRFFGGLSIEETAAQLCVAPATVKRHWIVAKAYLNQQLKGRPP